MTLIVFCCKERQKPEEIVSFLIPFIEGYTIVNNDISLTKQSVVEMMIKLISTIES